MSAVLQHQSRLWFSPLSLRMLLVCAVAAFLAKAVIEVSLWGDDLLYAAMSTKAAIANHAWYLLVAGLGQGAVFVLAMLFVLTSKGFARVLAFAVIGALTSLWGANVIHNYDVIGLCIGTGTLSPLSFAPSIPQTTAGALIGATIACRAIRL
ncbi:hypothetical protein [Ruegeria jejuensis]|uniref:hypothetical protein n=1 Tax=Ruegeria jejuensis TaxID=3233338 RepID=UPI00355AFBF9